MLQARYDAHTQQAYLISDLTNGLLCTWLVPSSTHSPKYRECVGSGCQGVMWGSSHKCSDERCHRAASSCDQRQHLHAIAHADDARAICHLQRSMAGASVYHHSYLLGDTAVLQQALLRCLP